MADGDASLALAGEFPPARREDWLALAGDLAPLRTHTLDGITIEPLYTADDALADAGVPGLQPFVRGRTALGTRDGWDVRQVVDVTHGHRAAVAELERGATSVWLRFDGEDAVDSESLDLVLDGVLFDIAPVVLDAGGNWPAAGRALRTIWDRAGVDPAALRGSLGADPFGRWSEHRQTESLDGELTDLVELANVFAAEQPNVAVATIDGTRFHDRGASEAEELGTTLAVVVATLRALTDGGLDLATAFAALEVRLAATVDQFATIAKFRAARRLVARVAEVAGERSAAGQVSVHAVTSRAMATRYDPAVNIVRATVACFGAAAGGADAITVLPHDGVSAVAPSDLSRRLARNTQTILGLESNVARVIDPAGGSWYVERLTDELAGRAWDVFQEIETAGGFRSAVEAGIVDDRIAAVRQSRAADIDHRQALIVGVSAFPSTESSPPSDERQDAVHRWSAGFEALRTRADAVAAASGRRPAVFLARLGAAAATAAPATAASHLFAIAGIDARLGPATSDVGEIVTAFAGSGTSVACICSGGIDTIGVDELNTALSAAGAQRIYSVDDLHRGGDARSELAGLLELLHVP